MASKGASSRCSDPPGAEHDEVGLAGMVSLGMPGLRGFFGGMSDAMMSVMPVSREAGRRASHEEV